MAGGRGWRPKAQPSSAIDFPTETSISFNMTIQSLSLCPSKPQTAPSQNKPVVIGIYGISGSGKTYILHQLRRTIGTDFNLYEGSLVIDKLVPGGLDVFKASEENDQFQWRELAINTIHAECVDANKPGVVSGHFMLWPQEQEMGEKVMTGADLDVYSHIIYLDIPPTIIDENRRADLERDRPIASVEQLQRWQACEKTALRSLCREHGILFFPLSASLDELASKVEHLVVNFKDHSEEANLATALARADDAVETSDKSKVDTILVFDADRTLAPQDTGSLFWKMAAESRRVNSDLGASALKDLFKSNMGYTYNAFRQSAFLYDEVAEEGQFLSLCNDVSAGVEIHPDLVHLMNQVSDEPNVMALVVTCGLACVWQKVLGQHQLSQSVKVIGGSRALEHGSTVITPQVKSAIVEHLQQNHNLRVWAFGDSPVDLPMLAKADEAIVVVGDRAARSRTMDAALEAAIGQQGLKARQILLPSGSPPRLNTDILPQISFSDRDVIEAIFGRRAQERIHHATEKNAVKLLMTATRNANISGPALREAHYHVGRYVATEFVTDIVGVEPYQIPHVQATSTTGYRLLDEGKTLIIALMRGGEPMAFGVSAAFPLAMFLHARKPGDIDTSHVQGRKTIILVDSVINTGKSIIEFVEHIRELAPNIKIVVVAGVVQSECVARWSGSRFYELVNKDLDLSITALRVSQNKYTGTGSTDTGNRLFNTVHLP
ncbi:hypothetical protein jhhlp_000480 [Lomentospora prolificans]|uniref:Phosphoribosyltransferase domain-containing protein n=1 Tax=Lomentospora prolificans TaxID=41688 RepID=A0A2N3NL54_9PEZI|nr:hypothetical protein jhhlp_000480 [Lomentospora prolificans]